MAYSNKRPLRPGRSYGPARTRVAAYPMMIAAGLSLLLLVSGMALHSWKPLDRASPHLIFPDRLPAPAGVQEATP